MLTLKPTWHHLRRSPFQSLVALLTTFLSFFIITFFIITSNGFSRVLSYFESKPEITIFLKDGLDRLAVEALQKDLSSYPSIKEIEFISKEKALSLYREQNKANPLLTEMVTASILPASFEVSVTDPKILKNIYDDFSKKSNLIEEIVFQQDIVDSLVKWSNIIRQLGIISSFVLLSLASLIILVIIGMKVTSHRDEIRISRLLGASRYRVERPFLNEGIVYGLFGSLSGFIVSSTLFFYFRGSLNRFFDPVLFVETDPSFYLSVAVLEIVGGIIIGYLSSWFSVRRFIKF